MKTNIEKITEIVRNQIDPEPFSGVICLTSGEEILYEQGFGFAIRAERISNKANTRFHMASGCKIFTSVAICHFVEQGKLEFNALLSDCVNETFPKYASEIFLTCP